MLPAAEALDGASVHLEGDALLDGALVRFSLSMPVARTGDTELGVPIVRVRVPEDEWHTITTADHNVVATFDPRPWLAGIDFATLCAEGCDELDTDGQAGRAVRNALTAGSPPTLQWNQQP